MALKPEWNGDVMKAPGKTFLAVSRKADSEDFFGFYALTQDGTYIRGNMMWITATGKALYQLHGSELIEMHPSFIGIFDAIDVRGGTPIDAEITASSVKGYLGAGRSQATRPNEHSKKSFRGNESAGITTQDPTRALIEALKERGLTIATAESLTGGLLAGELVGVPGASLVFNGGVVTYHTALKHTLLGVDADQLAATGPVDPLVARQMAEGARHACAVNGRPADIGLATTGVAGPDPDPQTGKPAGTVYLGVATSHGSRAVSLSLSGDRPAIRAATVAAAVEEALIEGLSLEPAVSGNDQPSISAAVTTED